MPDNAVEDAHGPSEAEHLLSEDEESMEMAGVTPESSRDGHASQMEPIYTDDPGNADSSRLDPVETNQSIAPVNRGQQTTFKVYKMRWFGLGQLVLLNIIVSWDVSSPRQTIRPMREEQTDRISCSGSLSHP